MAGGDFGDGQEAGENIGTTQLAAHLVVALAVCLGCAGSDLGGDFHFKFRRTTGTEPDAQ